MQSDDIETQLQSVLEEHVIQKRVLEKDVKFFHASDLPKFARYCSQNATDCSICKESLVKINELTQDVPTYLSGNISKRGEFEKQLLGIIDHLKHSHGMVQRGYMKTQMAFLGLVVGAGLGFVITKMINPNGLHVLLPVSTFAGMVMGNIWGILKERSLKKTHKFL